MNENRFEWQPYGGALWNTERGKSSALPTIPPGIYSIHHQQSHEIGTKYEGEAFKFPFKMYGIETSFIQRVLKTWDSQGSNLGILLNGKKGSGKTVTAKLIANRLVEKGVPTLIVDHECPGLGHLLERIEQPICILIDEYEKIFRMKWDGEDKRAEKVENDSLLAYMDGVKGSPKGKVMFLFTSNEIQVSKYMLERPSRIRYIKQFHELDVEVVSEVVKDVIGEDHPRLKATQDEILRLYPLTIDNIKSICNEIKIQDLCLEEAVKDFNLLYIDDFVRLENELGQTYGILPIGKGLIKKDPETGLIRWNLRVLMEGQVLRVREGSIGLVMKIVDEQVAYVAVPGNQKGVVDFRQVRIGPRLLGAEIREYIHKGNKEGDSEESLTRRADLLSESSLCEFLGQGGQNIKKITTQWKSFWSSFQEESNAKANSEKLGAIS